MNAVNGPERREFPTRTKRFFLKHRMNEGFSQMAGGEQRAGDILKNLEDLLHRLTLMENILIYKQEQRSEKVLINLEMMYGNICLYSVLLSTAVTLCP